MNLNRIALQRCEQLVERSAPYKISVSREESGARLVDCGVYAEGGLEAGRGLAEVCLAGLGEVSFAPGNPQLWAGPAVMVRTDQPLAACMASQYAGWQV